MTKRIEQLMARLERKYRKEGKTEAWIIGWKKKFYEVDRRFSK